MAIQKIPNTLIADNAVTAAKIANGTLTADDIAANSITGAKISATTSLNLAGLNSTGNVIIGSSSLSANAALKFAADTGTFTLEHDRGSHSLTLSDSDGTGEILRIDTSGKVGIGVTPKTDWHTGYNAIQIGQSSAFFANGAADEVFMSQNARWTSGSWKYNSSGTAALFDMQSGNTRWRRAASGSEDGTISWSDSMFIDTSGHVGIGTTSPTVDLDVSGPSSSMVLPGTSGTTPKGFLRVGYNDRNWGGTELLMGVINDGTVGYAGYLQAKAPTDYSVNRAFIINPLGGNVLVGTTSTTVGAGGAGVSGFRVDSDNGIVQAAASGNPSAIFNRTTSDGSIVSFRKNGAEVGSIGASVSDLTIYSSASGHSGFRFTSGGIAPVDNTGSLVADTVDIGQSSWKFRDIYLSGQALVQGGATTAPSFAFANDPDTGMSRPTSDAINFCTAGSERLRIDSSGRVNIGSQSLFSGSMKLEVQLGLTIKHSTTIGQGRNIYMDDNSGTLKFYSGYNLASLSSAGSWTNASDIAYKENIVDTEHGLDVVKLLQPRDYTLKSDSSSQTGFIAQELETHLPQFVDGNEGEKGVNYGQLTAVLTKAIQEQQTIIEDLKTRIETLEG